MTVKNMSRIQTKFGNARLNKDGYYMISSGKFKGKLLHRLIFEDFYQSDLNKEFPEGVVIHHINGDKTCNEIWNLVPMTNGEHTSVHKKGSKHSEEAKRKMSEKAKGENNYWYGKHLSEEHRRKISESRKGFVHSDETKWRMSEICKGRIHSLESKIKMSKNKNKAGFFRVHKTPHKECRLGFHWRYEYYDDDGKRKKLNSVDLIELKRKVLAKNLDWILLDTNNAKKTCAEYGYDIMDLV